MGSINTDSTTINFNGANIKIATLGKGLIFADGTTLSSNTEIGGGGGGSSNLQQVVDLGNVTSNTLLLENTGKTIVSSGNIESNIITTIIRFQEGSELPDGQGITLENAANNGNTVSNVIQFSNGFVVGSNLVVDEIGTNVIDVTGRIGATLFVGDGGLLSNISGGGGGSHTLQSVTENGSTTTEVVHFTNGLTSNGTLELLNSSGTEGIILRENGTIEICDTGGAAYIDFKNSYGDDWDFRIQTSSSSRALQFKPYGGVYTTIASDGSVGINNSSPSGRLHIKQTVDRGTSLTYDSEAAINIERLDNTNKWNVYIDTNNRLVFSYNKTRKVFMNDDGSTRTVNFTGQHRCFNQFSNVSNLVGMIVCSKSNKYINFDLTQSPTIDECLPVITISNVAYDKSCFGVISGTEEPGNRTFSGGVMTSVLPQESGDNRVIVNSLGEGAIWVSNLNGNLESGDYITTSNIAGYGQKQDSEFLANYTVAKITMECDFNPQMVPKRIIQKDTDGNNVLDSNGNLILEDSDELITQYEVKTLEDGTKAAFVGCTYHCG